MEDRGEMKLSMTELDALGQERSESGVGMRASRALAAPALEQLRSLAERIRQERTWTMKAERIRAQR